MPAELLIRTGFRQGVKPSHDPLVVPEDALWKAQNVQINESGVLRLRGGSRPFGESVGAGNIQGIAVAFGDILFVHNRTLYRQHSNGNLEVLLSDAIGTSNTVPVDIEPWAFEGQEIAYIFGGNGIYQTDGTPAGTKLVVPHTPPPGEATNLLGSDGTQDVNSGPARCTQVLLRPSVGIRLVASGNGAARNTVYMSDPARADYWPNNQWFNLPEGNAYITGFSQWYGALIIYRDKDIWAYFKADETDNTQKGVILQEPSIGCVAPRTIVAVPGLGTVFLGGPQGVADNVYVLSHVEAIENQVKATPIGDDIRIPLIQAIERYGLEGASAVYFDGEYRLSIPANPGHDKVFRLDLRHRAGWLTDSGPRTTQYIVKDNKLYGAMWNEGRLTQFTNDREDEGLAIPFHISFRKEDLQPGPSRIRKVFLYSVSKGRLYDQEIPWFSSDFNGSEFNEGDLTEGTVVIGTEQDIKLTLIIDGNVYETRDLTVRVPRTQALISKGAEPVRILEACFHPSIKGHFAQVIVDGTHKDQDYAILGYGLEFARRGVVRGIREGVTK